DLERRVRCRERSPVRVRIAPEVGVLGHGTPGTGGADGSVGPATGCVEECVAGNLVSAAARADRDAPARRASLCAIRGIVTGVTVVLERIRDSAQRRSRVL